MFENGWAEYTLCIIMVMQSLTGVCSLGLSKQPSYLHHCSDIFTGLFYVLILYHCSNKKPTKDAAFLLK